MIVNRQALSASRSNAVIAVVIISLFTALLTFAYLGFFTRYMADDYCPSIKLQRFGFWGWQRETYLTWTGKFSFTFVWGVATKIGPPIVPYVSTIALACWLAAAIWAVYQFACLWRWPRPRLTALLLGQLIVFATLNTSYNLAQSFYWLTGMLTYTSPLILAMFYAGTVSYGIRRADNNQSITLAAIGGAITTFIAGGFSETYLATQSTALGLLVLGFLVARAWRKLVLVGAGFVGSVLSLIVVVSAPGNRIRQSFFPTPPDVSTLLKLTLTFVHWFVYQTAHKFPLIILLLLVGPAAFAGFLYRKHPQAFAAIRPRRLVIALLLIPIATLALIIASYIPAVYATSADPVWRSRFIPQFVLAFGMTIWSFLAGLLLLSTWPKFGRNPVAFVFVAAVLALAVLSPALTIRRNMKLASRARINAAAWDQNDRDIRQARAQGVTELTVPAIDDMETALGGPYNELQFNRSPDHWKNRCAASYYGLTSLASR